VVRTLGSRLQNILVAGAIISIAVNLYGNRCRALILANSPERLGEWRRGLQDCLGISRSDFGPDRGVVLFESPEALIQRAERLVEDKLLPLVLIDDTQEQVDLALLQFPLWLAFAPDPQQPSSNYYF
jgi:pimeloyl-ACP methyl ester carboxylesterase